MISASEYFCKFLGFQMGSISNSNLSPHNCYYESYRALDSRLLEYHAAEDQNPGALEELGERFFFDDGDTQKAISYLQKASQLGHGEASGILSQIYRSQDHYDMKKYFHYLQLGAEQGSSMAMFNLSCAYYKGKEAYNGYGFSMDKVKSFQWCSAAAKRAMEFVETMLTIRCTNSFRENLQQQIQLAVKCTCVAADQLIAGDGVSKDIAAAKKMLTDANDFFEKYINQRIPDFDAMLKKM